jgi:hypothetical protein
MILKEIVLDALSQNKTRSEDTRVRKVKKATKAQLQSTVRFWNQNELPTWLKTIKDLPSDIHKHLHSSITVADSAGSGDVVFVATDEFCSVRCGKETYSLTKLAGHIAQVLHDEAVSTGMALSTQEIRRKTQCRSVWDAFRRRDGPKFWKRFIVKTDKDKFMFRH